MSGQPPGLARAMLTIKSLDDDAVLRFSKFTGKWYVDADIKVSDGCVIGGITVHKDTPDQAVYAFLARLQSIDADNTGWVLVTDPDGPDRNHWRWNGVAFATAERIPHHHADSEMGES